MDWEICFLSSETQKPNRYLHYLNGTTSGFFILSGGYMIDMDEYVKIAKSVEKLNRATLKKKGLPMPSKLTAEELMYESYDYFLIAIHRMEKELAEMKEHYQSTVGRRI